MSVHPSGDGAAWDSLEAVDVDQPHGKDYLYSQHLAKAVRKRNDQEHSAYGDSTAGGIHKPGGCAVLAMDVTNAAGDPTGNVVADGTYRGHGLGWTYTVEAGANKGRLWCATAAAGASTTGDWTLVKLHPDLQWGSQDITWNHAGTAGVGHEFDCSIDITGPVWVDGSCDFSDVHVAGDLTVAGAILVDGSCDFSDVYVDGDLTIKGNLKVDSTAAEFGQTAGIGLFYDPTVVAAAVESITFPNGLIFKRGEKAAVANGQYQIAFAAAFPNGILSANVIPKVTQNDDMDVVIEDDLLVGSFDAYVNNANFMTHLIWQAWGY